MTDRAKMDGPAMGLAVLMGVLLVGAGGAGLYFVDSLTSYDVEWLTTPTASVDGRITEAQEGHTVTLRVEDAYVAAVVVTLSECTEDLPQALPVTFSWNLRRQGSDAVLAHGDATCEDETWEVPISERPAVSEVEAARLADARARVWQEADGNTTTAFELEVDWHRQDRGTLPIPGQAPVTFEATFGLQALAWGAAVGQAEEVLR